MDSSLELSGRRTLATGLAAVMLVLCANGAGAQGLSSHVSSSTGSTCSANSANGYCGGSATATTTTASTFTSRYVWNVNADTDIGSSGTSSGTAQHNMSFQATAPGSYRLEVSVTRSGDLNRSPDDPGCSGSVDIGLALGSSNRGLSSGSLTLADPGSIAAGGTSSTLVINQSAAGVIGPIVSNGVARNHTLTFTWNGSATSDSCEAAVRLGEQNGTTSGCPGCEYPGSPARTQANDGHVVTVTFTSFCGDGVVNGTGEDCDLGGLNGAPASCCTSSCTFRSSSETCRASAGPCDQVENCTGSSGTCPVDGFQPDTTVCRTAAGPCDEAESCSGSGTNCPPDAKGSGICREAAGGCDTVEQCDGVANDCPADAVEPAGTNCRPSAGACDLAETCDGSDTACPADAKSTDVCRSDAGACDVAENCDGFSDDCPPDGFEPNGTSCADTTYCNGEETCDEGACFAIGGPCDSDQTCDEGLQLCFVGNCPSGPALACNAAGGSALLLKNKVDDTRDKFVWKFLKGQMFGQGDFADPTADSDYTLCFYAGAAEELVAEANLPANATLFGALGDKGWAYKDPARAQAGIGKLVVKGGGEGKTKALAKGGGAGLPDFPLPFGAAPGEPVIVQLRNSATGRCLVAVFDSPTKDSADQFKAREP